MPTANARKGAETERMVAKYLRTVGFPEADRRLREGRNDDQGDIDGVPFAVVQVKYWAERRLQKWVTDTLKQRDEAGVPLCLLVVRTPYQAVEKWDAYAPPSLWIADYSELYGASVPDEPLDEREAWTWVRTDLRLAAVVLKRYARVLRNEPDMTWNPYSSSTESS